MKNILSYVPKWRTLKFIGGSRIVALAGFFPFVGYLILANQGFSETLALVTDVVDGVVDSEKVSDRLRQIYFGMLSLSVGVLLFRVLCPVEVSQFRDRYDYIEKELVISTPARVIGLKARVIELGARHKIFLDRETWNEVLEVPNLKLSDAEVKDMTFPVHLFEHPNMSPEAYRSSNGVVILRILNSHFDVQNNCFGTIRVVCAAAFLYGYGSLALPSILVAFELISAR